MGIQPGRFRVVLGICPTCSRLLLEMLLELILYRTGAVYMTMPPPQQSTVGIPTIYIRSYLNIFVP